MGWIQKCDIHEEVLPVPTQIASNEEFIPPPQSPQQQEVEARTLEIAESEAQRHGTTRREFLRTGRIAVSQFEGLIKVAKNYAATTGTDALAQIRALRPPALQSNPWSKPSSGTSCRSC